MDPWQRWATTAVGDRWALDPNEADELREILARFVDATTPRRGFQAAWSAADHAGALQALARRRRLAPWRRPMVLLTETQTRTLLDLLAHVLDADEGIEADFLRLDRIYMRLRDAWEDAGGRTD